MSYSEALEQQLALADRMATADMREWCMQMFEKNAMVRGNIENVLRTVDSYYWSPAIVDAIADWKSIPPLTLTREMLSLGGGFFWFAKPIVVDDIEFAEPPKRPEIVGSYRLRALAWSYRYDGSRPADTPEECPGIAVFTFADLPYADKPSEFAPCMPVDLWTWEFGETNEVAAYVPEEKITNEAAALRLKVMATALTFINQRILTATAMRADRATRRRINIERFKDEPLVRVVEMRRREHHTTITDEHEAVDWSCQWVVSGHWRQQWYPSLNAFQPKWIMPYVKGPEDKPLRPPRAKVFAVVR